MAGSFKHDIFTNETDLKGIDLHMLFYGFIIDQIYNTTDLVIYLH